jgi:hypothetical protein
MSIKTQADQLESAIYSIFFWFVCVMLWNFWEGVPKSTVSPYRVYLKKTGWLNDRHGGIWMSYSLKKHRTFCVEALPVLIANTQTTEVVRQAEHRRLAIDLTTKTQTACC